MSCEWGGRIIKDWYEVRRVRCSSPHKTALPPVLTFALMTDSKRRPAGPSSGSVARFKEQHLMQCHSRKKPSEKISPSPPAFPEQPAIEDTSPEG
ncbi:hypothetical protein MHYP_G00192550 [Metynnis hypsauchen]